MDQEFIAGKIKQLTNEKLIELIRLKTPGNRKIIALAESEAVKRGIDVESIEPRVADGEKIRNRTKEDKGLYWLGGLAQFLDGFD